MINESLIECIASRCVRQMMRIKTDHLLVILPIVKSLFLRILFYDSTVRKILLLLHFFTT